MKWKADVLQRKITSWFLKVINTPNQTNQEKEVKHKLLIS